MAVFLLAVCLRVTVGYGGRLFIGMDVLKLVKSDVDGFLWQKLSNLGRNFAAWNEKYGEKWICI